MGKSSLSQKQVIGWREVVGLPGLKIIQLRAKIDTGARSSALHAVDIGEFEREGKLWVNFVIPIIGQKTTSRICGQVFDKRAIKNTSGIPEQRYLILTELVLGERRWKIELSLADRENMGFDLILGRTAIRRRRLVVDAGRSFLAGVPIQQSGSKRTRSVSGTRNDN